MADFPTLPIDFADALAPPRRPAAPDPGRRRMLMVFGSIREAYAAGFWSEGLSHPGDPDLFWTSPGMVERIRGQEFSHIVVRHGARLTAMEVGHLQSVLRLAPMIWVAL